VIRYRFPARNKLNKTDEFSSVFSFRRRINSSYLALHYMPNALEYPRLGIVVSKKIVRRAHARNYMKRVVRELFRLHRHDIACADIVIRAQKPFAHEDFAQVSAEFMTAIAKLARYMAPIQ